MKIITSMMLLIFGILISNVSSAQSKSERSDSIKIWGNCGMCEENIEKAAKTAGASSAAWSEENKMLAVSYNPGKTNSYKIQQAIALAGYDTQDLKANDKAYDKLHGCCKYDRKPVDTSTSDNKK